MFRGSGSIVYDNEQYQNGRQYRQCGCGSTTDGLRYHGGSEDSEEAVDAARSGDTAGAENEIQEAAAMAEEEAAMPEGEAAEDSANMAEMTDSASTDSGQQAASGNSIDGQKQSGLESALSVSGNESSQDSTEAAPEEDGILKKKERQLPKKMTVKGQ